MQDRERWVNQPTRMRASQIRVGDTLLGGAPVALRPRVTAGTDYRVPFTSSRSPAEATGFEIRISVGRAVREPLAGTATGLDIWEKDGGEWVRWTFEDVTWRRSCCRLLGYTTTPVWNWERTSEPPP